MFDVVPDHRTRHRRSRSARAVVTAPAQPRLARPHQPSQTACSLQARSPQLQSSQQPFQQ